MPPLRPRGGLVEPRVNSCCATIAPVLVGDAPVSVQSMATTVTADVNSAQQIAELTAAGCQVVRVAVPSERCRGAPDHRQEVRHPGHRRHPLPAQVRVRAWTRLRGVASTRNIKQFDDKVGEIARAAADCGTPIRIGVNAGSLDKRLMEKYGKATLKRS